MSNYGHLLPYVDIALWQLVGYGAVIFFTAWFAALTTQRILRRKEQADYLRLQEECDEAMLLQSLLLPQESLLDALRHTQKLDIAYYYHPCSELGGDHIATYRISEHRTAVMIADFVGHGITAALYTFALHTLLEKEGLFDQGPDVALTYLNARLYDVLMKGKFATMFLGIIDTQEATLTYATAAAPPPLLMVDHKIRVLDSKGFLLGAQKDTVFESRAEVFRKGDLLLIYSDALVETPNASGQTFTLEALSSFIVQEKDTQQNSAVLLKKLLSHFFSHYDKHPSDDLSVLICQLH